MANGRNNIALAPKETRGEKRRGCTRMTRVGPEAESSAPTPKGSL